jgi:hypothetical protein
MPTPTYRPLATVTLGTATASVTFSSIPATYRDLVVVTSLRTNRSGENTDAIRMRFNADSGSNYPRVAMFASSGGAGTFEETSSAIILTATAATSTANTFTPSNAQIMDYSATDKHKTVLLRNAQNLTDVVLGQVNRWANTAAITSLAFTSANSANFEVGSTFALYGIAS